MLTRKQAADQRRAIQRDIDRDLRQKSRAKIQGLRSKLHAAYAHKKARLAEISCHCRDARVSLRDRQRETRKRLLEELRETTRAERAAARSACALRKDEAKKTAKSAIDRAFAKFAAERAYQADLKRIEQGNRVRRIAHATHAARQTESDDEVRGNIPEELVPLFNKVKRGIRATPRISRTEAFLKYVEENPGEAFAVIEDRTERMIRELEKQHAHAAREVQRATGPRMPANVPRRKYTRAELDAVPF